MTASLFLAAMALAIWAYLIIGHGRFWRATERDETEVPTVQPVNWPDVVAVVPARNEADNVPRSIGSLVIQDYPGDFAVVLVDDNSDDGTAEAARAAAAQALDRVAILRAAPMAPGWTGKLWAMSQGVAHIDGLAKPPKYLLLTDADIVHAPSALRTLVARAEANELVLTSRMVKLNCESMAERTLIPAFVFFFQMLYPFAWVNRRDCRTAAAAGGCMLVERKSLAASGGITSIRAAVIDDCALAARLKTRGAVWIGLTNNTVSIRAYPTFEDVRCMVSCSAYAQLDYSPLILLGTLLGLALVYLVAPIIALLGSGIAQLAAAAAWGLMALAFLPTLQFYRLSPLWAPFLPAIAAIYMGFTLDSAYQHMRGRGGMWKGRAQAHSARGR